MSTSYTERQLLAPNRTIVDFLNRRLEALDERLLASFPSLGRFSAVTIMEMRK